jgi:dUTP pyrophosphatase
MYERAGNGRWSRVMSEDVIVEVMQCEGCEDLKLPEFQTDGAAGMDLLAAVDEPVLIQPGEYTLVSSGIRLSIPKGYEGQVRPRSGLALHHGIGLLNAPGTIDSDYRGVVGVILFNFGKDPFRIERGDRIAQLVIASVSNFRMKSVDTLEDSDRSTGGFGSTGKK